MIDNAPPCAGGFLPGERLVVPPTGRGRLDGFRFAVKDLIDLAGRRTGGGNPDWLAAEAPAPRHAPVVTALLAAGATCVGKTITDELAFSLEGANSHYGTPPNPLGRDWLPGGSSSGSAVAVASGAVEFALGTDTGGSVRVPAALCGIFGFRPSHGAVSAEGVLPFAPGYDTVGWLARDAATLAQVGDVLLAPALREPIASIRIVEDAVSLLEPSVGASFREAAERITTAASLRIFDRWPLKDLKDAYTTIQGYEIRMALGALLDLRQPRFGPTIAPRFAASAKITREEYQASCAWREDFTQWLDAMCPQDCALALPAASVAFLRRDATGGEIDHFYATTLGLAAVASHSRRPQVQFGRARAQGLAVSIIGARGADRALLDLAQSLNERGLET
ncbi:MAG: amidase [Bradyrhizobium sp.]|nr:MAG: amidase [Bradyrhizobium sp.]